MMADTNMEKKKRVLKHIYIFFFLSLTLAVAIADAGTPDIVKKQASAVVTVYVNGKDGKHILSESGFVIDK